MYNYKTIGANKIFPSKDLDLLHPKVKELALKFLDECKKDALLKDCEVKITQTLRSIDYQNQLYAQGRTKPGVKVTNAIGGNSMHNYGVAFDFAIFKDKKYLTGQTKQEALFYSKAGEIGKKIGLFWGGDFKNIHDSGHMQYTGKYDNNTALSLLKKGISIDELLK